MAAVRSVLIVGGGFSGLAAALAFRRHGVAVTLVEQAADCGAYGAGISIGGATLRALGQLGVLADYFAVGFGCELTEMRGIDDSLIQLLPAPRLAGADVPGNGAVMRPALARILQDAAVAAGADVRLRTTLADFRDAGAHIHARLSDGSAGEWDLLVGADGLHSALRARLFPGAPAPAYSGQGVWRAVLPRIAGVDHTMLWLGEDIKIGLNPVSADERYLFVNENRPVHERVDEAQLAARLIALLAAAPAPLVQQARALIGPESRIIFRPLEGLLQPLPWHRGRAVLIGDAVHATTPHLASGAGIGIEDGIVLAEECTRHANVGQALATFGARRWERCRMVVENSARLGEIEIAQGDRREHAELMRASFAALAEAI